MMAGAMRSIPILACLAVLAAGCGARQANDSDFERLQVAEAELDRASYAAFDTSAPCEGRCDAARRMERAASDACALADRVEDADARARCEDARRRAREGRAGVDAACGCGARGEGP